VEVTAADFVRAIERTARLTGPGFFSVVQGYDDFAAGKTVSIPGLETPDRNTLVVRLAQPAGDLAYRFTLPSATPIPPRPGDPTAPYGIATGHDIGDGPFLVGSGPYMLRGIDKVDFTRPPEAQVPAAGDVPGRSLSLVRNPSWDSSTDSLRAAYPDRIEISISGTLEQASQALDDGRNDLLIYAAPPPQAPPDQISRYQKQPGLGQVKVYPRDFIRYISMNLAVPPFDDIHVRRAVSLVIDKQAVLDAQGRFVGKIAGHIGLDSLEDNLLVSYDPYRTPGGHGDLARAKQEMMLSRYDTHHDGMCDADVCKHVLALQNPVPLLVGMAPIIRRNLAQVGIVLEIPPTPDVSGFLMAVNDPTTHRIALGLGAAWGKDYLNASDFFAPLFSSTVVTGDPSLLGATPDQLKAWGYQVRSVPSVDNRIQECNDKIGSEQTPCWASLDTYLMEEVVPWVPLAFENQIQVVPKRVVAFSFDQLANMPALDRIAVKR
jgi:peptide/nickel transport system substrate-binding protein